MKRNLGGGYELDDDASRIDVGAVHEYLSEHSYWARGRARETVEHQLREATRVVGLYKGGRQIGFTRTCVVPGMRVAYLFDVYVLPDHRGRGLGVDLLRLTVDDGPFDEYKWLLDTVDAHGLYEKFGFGPPPPTHMQRAAKPAP